MLSFPELYEEVVSRAGGEQSTAEDVIRVERSVRIVLERWQASSYLTWRVQQTTISVSGTSPSITLPDSVDDVLRVTLKRDPNTIDMRRMSGAEYMLLSSKDRVGTPSQYWLDRTIPPQLFIFPIGDPYLTEEIDLWYVERPKEFERGSPHTEGIPGRWLEALVTACAHDLACKRPSENGIYDEGLIARLDASRLAAEDFARRADRDRARFRYRIGRR